MPSIVEKIQDTAAVERPQPEVVDDDGDRGSDFNRRALRADACPFDVEMFHAMSAAFARSKPDSPLAITTAVSSVSYFGGGWLAVPARG